MFFTPKIPNISFAIKRKLNSLNSMSIQQHSPTKTIELVLDRRHDGRSFKNKSTEIPGGRYIHHDEGGMYPSLGSKEAPIEHDRDWLSIEKIGIRLADDDKLLGLFLTYFHEDVANWCRDLISENMRRDNPYRSSICIYMVNELAKSGFRVKKIYEIINSRYLDLNNIYQNDIKSKIIR